ncbi:MAG TPA: LCP family protein [Candidatus Limnocylindria bacterium]|nr:LCP family protein [Candidatus Limnocylindria bacterium]
MSRNRSDEVPYDRELIRSGGVAATRGRVQEGSSPRRRRVARPARRRRSPFRAIGILFLILLVAAGVGIFLLGTRAAAFNATVSTAPFPSTALFGALNGTDRVNVLMIGYGGGDHAGAYLADSIQILSIDPETDTTTTIPIPRDLWIEGVTEFSQNGKINEVFAVGQAEEGIDAAGDRLAEVVSDVTGLEIHHWLSIDFTGFEEMVDAVGGVTVQNPVAFSYTNLESKHQAGNWDLGTFRAGEIHLDGAQALAYSRARYTSVVAESNDFARSIRQARVLAALRSKLGDGGLGSIGPGLQLMDAMEGRVRTDLSVIDLALVSSHLSSDRRIELSEGPVLTATTNTIGQYILVPTGWTGPGDYGGLHAYIADQLAQPIPSASPSDGAAP